MSKQAEATPQQQPPEPFLRYPSGGKYVMVRVEHAALCQDPIEALILRFCEYEIECKRRAWHERADKLEKQGKPRPKEPKRWWIALSYQRLLWMLRHFIKSKNTLIAKLASLLEKKLLLRRGDPYHGYQYTIDRTAMQKLFDALSAESLSLRFPDAVSASEEGDGAVPNSGTPPTSDPSQRLVQTVPNSGTHCTKDRYSAVPSSGTQRRSKKEDSQDLIKKDSALSRLLSFPSVSFDLSQVRYAPWESATIISLSSVILQVPDLAAVEASNDPEVLAQYLADWQRPAERLLALTSDLDPARAWEHIERRIRGMISGPTWYATKRARSSPITLRHVVGFNKTTGELNDGNWRVVGAELDKAQWWHSERTPYDGPLPYELGYGGVSPVNDVPEHPTPAALPVPPPAPSLEITVPVAAEEAPTPQESPPAPATLPPRGMTEDDAVTLMEQIWTEYPMISLALAQNTLGLFYVAIEEPPGERWLHVKSWHAWLSPWPRPIEARIMAAVEFGRQRLAAEGSEDEAAMTAAMEGGG